MCGRLMFILLLFISCSEDSERNDLTSVPEKQTELNSTDPDNGDDSGNDDGTGNNSGDGRTDGGNNEPDDNPIEPSDDTAQQTDFGLYDFTLQDANPYSSLYQTDITPSAYLGEVTGWYFIKAT